MPKYKNPSRQIDDETTYSEELEATQGTDGGQEEPAGGEDSTFKKRYSDLRRHMQQRDEQHAEELRKIKEQLDAATKQQIKFPKSKEEIEAWSKKYPEVSKIVESIASMKASEALEQGTKQFEDLREMEKRIKRKEAEQELLKLHPDFGDIRADDAFHEWADQQPQYIRDALYKNDTDAHAAARAIDLYKADTGNGKKRRGAETDPASAAEAVRAGGGSSAPEGRGKPKFTESQVARMSDAEYEKNEDAILAAMRSGNFTYDMTGGAR